MNTPVITVIGGGLAGCEAAWQAARRGHRVRLFEMKPQRYSPAHKDAALGELVCSNSLRAADPHAAVGLLKEEMRRLGSLVMAAAGATQVPAGRALAVDRHRFARYLTQALEDHPLVEIVRQEIQRLPEPGPAPVILATGPLTSDPLAEDLARLTGRDHLAFYDAIAPIVATDSLDHTIVYRASRYEEGPGDYYNCPMTEPEYFRFLDELRRGTTVPLREFEEPAYFEGCLPIEVMAARGDHTLRFGPMKPVGLPDPRTGREPFAVVQLRLENLEGSACNMVGFQTKLTYPEQRRIFRLIPGMAQAEFLRYGSIHRNTFVCGPLVLTPTLQCRMRPDLYLAGQITGVEGYVESAAMGILAGLFASLAVEGRVAVPPPADTAHGALVAHVSRSDPKRFQPSNVNYGLFPPLPRKVRKKDRPALRAQTALTALAAWQGELAGSSPPAASGS